MEGVNTPPSDDNIPSAGNDSGDPLRPELEEENDPDAPVGAPNQDVEATEDIGLDSAGEKKDDDDNLSDDSALSEVDDEGLDEFDEGALNIADRPVAVDESNVALLGVHRRKRAEGEDGTTKRRKKSTRKRPKDTAGAGGDEGESRPTRERKSAGERRERRKPTPEDDSNLTPEERRKKALDRAMDEAIKGPSARRKKKGGIVRGLRLCLTPRMLLDIC
jgi:transcription factor SPN1